MTIEMEDTEHQPSGLELGKWNQWFHHKFRQRLDWHRQRITGGEILLIVRMDSRLISCQGEKIASYEINSSTYHSLKAISHLPLACCLSALFPDSPQEWHELEQSLVELKQMDSHHLPGFESVMSQCRLLLQQCQARQGAVYQDLKEMAQRVRPLIAGALQQAAEDEINQLVPALDEIAGQTSADRAHTFMVVMGGHQPRYRELSKLIFRRWFEENAHPLLNFHHHVHFCEGGQGIDDAVELVARVLANQELSEAFLQSAVGLDQDVLGIVAKRTIDNYWLRRE
ncbi:hypothetical protein [Bowmanella dokdonensis]|uniref:Uncharacterized protein n=1 Tax=Bowmanella dokdonensis TaxID=751969 RepID=A0A939DM40_9ALTE|nr:hypothetical protein [Bowmanella dokdonensis]MBN7825110.1 hypothetical protein [Bowmanella dokdonensis]